MFRDLYKSTKITIENYLSDLVLLNVRDVIKSQKYLPMLAFIWLHAGFLRFPKRNRNGKDGQKKLFCCEGNDKLTRINCILSLAYAANNLTIKQSKVSQEKI